MGRGKKKPAPQPADMTDALKALEERLTAAQQEIEHQRETVAKLSRERIDLKTQIAKLNEPKVQAPIAPQSSIEAAVSAAANHAAATPPSVEERNMLQKERDLLRAQLEAHRQEATDALRVQAKELEALHARLDPALAEVARLTSEREVLQNRLARLRGGAADSSDSPYVPQPAPIGLDKADADAMDASFDEAAAFPGAQSRKRVFGIMLVTGAVLLFFIAAVVLALRET